MWSLLSPEDASSGGGTGGGDGSGAAGGSSSSSKSGSAVPSATAMAEEAEAKPSDGTAGVEGSGGDGCSVPGISRDRGVASDQGGGTLSDLARFALAGGGGSGGRGAVRLVQTVAAVQTPYRYAAVLHFWDVVSD